QIDAARTESPVTQELIERASVPKFIRLEHAAYGLATEAGELLDQLKKHKFYGKPLDFVNLEEEAGDVAWYLALVCNALGVDMQAIMDRNIQKLRTRFPEKFSADGAINRDLDAERKVLEGA